MFNQKHFRNQTCRKPGTRFCGQSGVKSSNSTSTCRCSIPDFLSLPGSASSTIIEHACFIMQLIVRRLSVITSMNS